MNDASEPTDRKHPYWDQRQQNLGIDTHGETLTINEIKFVERFCILGESLEWIARDLLPTADFIWFSRCSIECELKSTKPKYSTIRNQIAPDVAHARAKHVRSRKIFFIVDIGSARLTPKLRSQLALYNLRNPKNMIRRLWIMHSNGVLEEIPLRAE